MSNTMGERIKELLKKSGMTQKELSERAKITEAAISHYIKGNRVPRATVLSKIAIVLNSTPEYILEGIPNGTREELGYAKKLIARNVSQMSMSEKREIINILMGDGDE